MIALMKTNGCAIALEPDFIESVDALTADEIADHVRADKYVEIETAGAVCRVGMASGAEYIINRSYQYVTGIIRKHNEAA